MTEITAINTPPIQNKQKAQVQTFMPETKVVEHKKNNSGKIVGTLLALGAIGAGIYLVRKNSSSNNTKKELKKNYNEFLELIKKDETTDTINKIKEMVTHKDDRLRLSCIKALLDEKSKSKNLHKDLQEPIIDSLMLRPGKEKELNSMSIFEVDNISQIHSFFESIEEISPSLSKRITENMSKADDETKANTAAELLSTRLTKGNSKLLTHAEKMDSKDLISIADSLNDIKQKDFTRKTNYILEGKKTSVAKLKLNYEYQIFQKNPFSDESTSRIKKMMENEAITEESKLGLAQEISETELKTDDAHPKTNEFLVYMINKISDFKTNESKDFKIDSFYHYDQSKFSIMNKLFNKITPSGSSEQEQKLKLIPEIRKNFQYSKDSWQDEFARVDYNSLWIEELELKSKIFDKKYPKKVSSQQINDHTDDMLETFKNASENFKTSYLSSSQESILNSKFTLFNLDMQLKLLKNPEIDSKESEKINQKINNFAEKYFKGEYKKYKNYNSNQGNYGGSSSMFNSKIKEAKDYIAEKAKDIDDEKLKDALNRVQSDTFTKKDITTIRKKIMLKYHPDRIEGDEKTKRQATTIAQQINDHIDIIEKTAKD